MSKYHELRIAIAEGDLTPEGVAAKLWDVLELNGYGTAFQVFRDGVPVDEEAVRQAIIGEITAPPAMEKYQQKLQRLHNPWRDWAAFVEADPAGRLMFEHGDDFRRPLGLGGLEVVFGPKKIEQRLNRRTKGEIGRGERAESLRKKLEDTQGADEESYLLHANQCGCLVRNTTMRFWKTGVGQRGTSTMTRIVGIALPELQEFIDSAGRATLSMISTHMDPDLVKTEAEDGVTAMHSDFAKAIVDFLDLEGEVDIDGIKRQYGESESDSGFRSIEHWGGNRETVLGKLKERRGNLDPGKIAAAFDRGYGPGPAA